MPEQMQTLFSMICHAFAWVQAVPEKVREGGGMTVSLFCDLANLVVASFAYSCHCFCVAALIFRTLQPLWHQGSE